MIPRPAECVRGEDEYDRPYCVAHGSGWPCSDVESLHSRVALAMHLRMGGSVEQWEAAGPDADLDREGYWHLADAAIGVMRSLDSTS